jgi:TonB family protein
LKTVEIHKIIGPKPEAAIYRFRLLCAHKPCHLDGGRLATQEYHVAVPMMKARNVFQVIALPALIAVPPFAKAAQQPEPQKSAIQYRAEGLMERARHLSDIRAPNSPAFRLRANFSFTGKNLETAHGTYTEIWLSNSRWRRETIVNNIHRIEVGTADRIWRLDNSTDFPESAARLPDLMNVFPQPSRTFEFESITDVTDQKIAEQCATTLPGPQKEKYRFCFDQKSGALLAKLSPEFRPKNLTDYSCFYGIFRKFGDFWFPREMACLEDKHRTLEAKIEELSVELSPDAALFQPPQGALELCSTKPVNPTVLAGVGPSISSNSERLVVLRVSVNAKGKPQDIAVSESGGKRLDEAAIEAVGKWRFKPATCNGQPIPGQVNLRFSF